MDALCQKDATLPFPSATNRTLIGGGSSSDYYNISVSK
jgi:hypothetical protein